VSFGWFPQSSGIEIPAQVAEALEIAWQRHLESHHRPDPMPVPVPMPDLSSVVTRVGQPGSVIRPSRLEGAVGGGPVVAGGTLARRSSTAKQIGDRAELLVKRLLEQTLPQELLPTLRHHAANGETPGYDLSYGPADSVVAVEVKGSVQASVASIELTANEWGAAKSLGDRYHLYIVGNVNSTRPVIEVIENAAARLVVKPTVYLGTIEQA
jgi:hypothetical protein